MSEKGKVLMPVEQQVVGFYGNDITAVTIKDGGQFLVYIPVRPICDYLGVD